MISPKGISMDKEKVTAVSDWHTLNKLWDVQCFLGFANFYRCFIQGYLKIVESLTRLTRKDTPFAWNLHQEQAFTRLKGAFTTATILVHYDFSYPSIIETDASDFVC